MSSVLPVPSHIARLRANIDEIRRLLDIHKAIGGGGPGYKHDVEVLNKSGIVLLVACWEAFVEDLATNSFSVLLERSKECTTFPAKVLAVASRDLRADPNETKVWELAGSGWKDVLSHHRDKLLKRFVGSFNTPRPAQVDSLFHELVGLSQLSSYWHWKGVSKESASAKLEKLVTLRGEIAHRVAASRKVGKGDVRRNMGLIIRLAVVSSNRLNLFIQERTLERAWRKFAVAPGS